MPPLARIGAAVRAAVGLGQTSAPPTDGPIGSTQVKLSSVEVKDAIPHGQLFGFASATPVGTDVVLLFLGGDRANGVAVASNHQAYRPRGMVSGEAQIHDASGQSVYLKGGNTILITGKGMVEIVAPNGVMINGTVTVTGDVVANGISLTQHDHLVGGSPSGPPQG